MTCPPPAQFAQADELLAKAKAKYEGGDRMTAIKLYEDVLKEVRRSRARRRAVRPALSLKEGAQQPLPAQTLCTNSRRAGANVQPAASGAVRLHRSARIFWGHRAGADDAARWG